MVDQIQKYYLPLLNEHAHSAQKVAPMGAAAILVTSAAGAWNLGNFSNDILAAGVETEDFDIHFIDVIMNNNTEYELVLYYGAADIECSRVTFTRVAAADRSFQSFIISGTPQHTPIPAGSRIRAKLRDLNGAGSCVIKIHYHNY